MKYKVVVNIKSSHNFFVNCLPGIESERMTKEFTNIRNGNMI